MQGVQEVTGKNTCKEDCGADLPDAGVEASEGRSAVLRVHACGRAWDLEREADLESLWEAMSDFSGPGADDERLPYWTELWPASLALADWLGQQQAALRGQACIDLGCGIGLTALVGQWLGARVLAMDYEAEALHYARRNAVRNGIAQAGWTVMDWRRPAVRAHAFRFIWGGDIMYERRFAAPVLDFLNHALAEDGLAWLAEPSRSVYDTFRCALASRGWRGRCVCESQVQALYPQAVPVPVRLWEIRR